jgi:hypothetical protein
MVQLASLLGAEEKIVVNEGRHEQRGRIQKP